jgi:hypothetical protein
MSFPTARTDYASMSDNNAISLRQPTDMPAVMDSQQKQAVEGPPSPMSASSPILESFEEAGTKPSRDTCDRRRPEEHDASRLPNMSQQLMNKTMTPFLREHIPGIYAPLGKPENLPQGDTAQTKDPNSKYCYRHRPDSKCRRAADESKMALIQSVSPPNATPSCSSFHTHYVTRNSRLCHRPIGKQSPTFGLFFLLPPSNTGRSCYRA